VQPAVVVQTWLETVVIVTVVACLTELVVDLVEISMAMVLLEDRQDTLMPSTIRLVGLAVLHSLLELSGSLMSIAASVVLAILVLFLVAVEMVLATTIAAAIKLVTAVLVSFALDLNKGEQWQSLV
jgi:hypothetical protein